MTNTQISSSLIARYAYFDQYLNYLNTGVKNQSIDYTYTSFLAYFKQTSLTSPSVVDGSIRKKALDYVKYKQIKKKKFNYLK
jgi:hypothetical protein